MVHFSRKFASFFLFLLFLAPSLSLMVNAATQQETHASNEQIINGHVKPYVLKKNETIYVIATRYGLSVNQLKDINRLRSFANGFEHIAEGDELDVPASRSPFHSTQKTNEGRAKDLAVFTQKTAHFLQKNATPHEIVTMAKNSIVGDISQTVHSWMNHWGNAQIQLNADENFTLKGSSFKLLHPWFDSVNWLLFTQSGVHRTDDRTQANIGGGYRYFSKNGTMLGSNIFWDYDLSREHSRLGFGEEYGRDYLKLSANAYIGLSGWKSSPDVVDYNERPANGWDIRAESYLPSYPQFGGKLVYEQYYGNEVGLFDKDERQKNPHAITGEINWTPFPLVTFKAASRIGKSNSHDESIGLEINYRFDTPIESQLDSYSVAELRSLKGSRYDFIDRNNNIVLEYKKQEIIHLSLPKQIQGSSGELVQLFAKVNAKYGLKNIELDSGTLSASGASIVKKSTDEWEIRLPPYHLNSQNKYTVSAIAYDLKGNSSTREEVAILVTAPDVDLSKSSLSVAANSLPADGRSQALVSINLRDHLGKPVSDALDKLSLSVVPSSDTTTTIKMPTLGKVNVGSQQGEYTAILVAGMTPGKYRITGTWLNKPLSSANITLTPLAHSAAQSTLTASTDTLPADGTATLTLTLKLRDANNNALGGLSTSLAQDVTGVAKDVKVGNWTESSSEAGTYSATVTAGVIVGHADVMPTLSGQAAVSRAQGLTLTPLAHSAAQSTLTASTDTLPADGTATLTLTLKLRDANNNALGGLSTSLAQDVTGVAKDVKVGNWTESSSEAGTYSATVTAGVIVGHADVMPTLSGQAAVSRAQGLTLTPLAHSAAQSTLTASTDTLPADGTATLTLTLKLRDANNNALGGLSTSLAQDVTGVAKDVKVGNWTESSSEAGTYSATVTAGGIAGHADVMPTLSGQAAVSRAQGLTLTPLAHSAAQSTLTASTDTLPADGTATLTLTLKLRDANNNALGGLSTSLAQDVTGVAKDVKVGNWTESSSEAGTYSATVTAGVIAGHADVMPTLSGQAAVSRAQGLTLTPLAHSAAQSTLTASTDTLPADGTATLTLTLKLRDANNNALGGLSTSLAQDVTGVAKDVKVGNWTESSSEAGTYSATVTAGGIAGHADVMPTLSGQAAVSRAQGLTLTPLAHSAAQSTLTASTDTLPADGTATLTLTLKLRDANNNALGGLSTSLAQDVTGVAKDVKVGNWTESSSEAGTYSATVTAGVIAGHADVMPTLSGQAAVSRAQGLTLTPLAHSAAQSTLTASTDTLPADGTATLTLTLKLRDANNNALGGLSTSLAQDVTGVAKDVKVGNWTESSSEAGTYSATVTAGGIAGHADVMPTLSGQAAVSRAQGLTLTPLAHSAAQSTLTASTDTLPADGTATLTLTLKLRDANNNALGGLSTSLAQDVTGVAKDVKVGNWTESSSEAGTYSATVTAGVIAGHADVMPTLSGQAAVSRAQGLTLTPLAHSAAQSTLTASTDTLPADGTATLTLTLKLRDANNNALGGLSTSLAQDVTGVAKDVKVGNWTESSSEAGTYSATVTAGGIAGHADVMPTLSGQAAVSRAQGLTLTPLAHSAAQSTLTASTDTLPADGTATLTLTLKLRDANNNALGGLSTSLAQDVTGVAKDVKVGNWTESSSEAGTYSATVTAGVIAGHADVMPTLSGQAAVSRAQGLTLTPLAHSAAQSTLTASTDTLPADGTATLTLTLKLRDANNNALGGLSTSLAQDVTGVAKDVKVGNWTESSSEAGTYSATVTAGVIVGHADVMPTLSGQAAVSRAQGLTLTPLAHSAAQSTLTASTDTLPADGTATLTLTLKLRDANNNALGGLSTSLAQDVTGVAKDVKVGNWTESSSEAGTYSATVTAGVIVGHADVMPTLSGQAAVSRAQGLTLTQSVDATKSTLTASTDTLPADGTATLTLTLKLRDANNNALGGLSTSLAQDVTGVAKDVKVGNWTESSSEAGTYSATVTAGVIVGHADVMPTLSGQAAVSRAQGLTLTQSVDATKSTLTASPSTLPADGNSTSQLTLTLYDSLNQPIAGKKVDTKLGGSGALDVIVSQWQDLGDGRYTATLSVGTTSGNVILLPMVDGKRLVATTVNLVPGEVLLGGRSTNAGIETSRGVAKINNTSPKQIYHGFDGASFRIILDRDNPDLNKNYTWVADQSWLNVDGNGTVVYVSRPNSSTNTVHFTMKPISGLGLTYQFILKVGSWIGVSDVEVQNSDANNECISAGYSSLIGKLENIGFTPGGFQVGENASVMDIFGDLTSFGFPTSGAYRSAESAHVSGWKQSLLFPQGVGSIVGDDEYVGSLCEIRF